MSDSDILTVLKRAGAVLTNRHFVYTSGKHGGDYINMDPLFPDASLTLGICRKLAEPYAGSFETVASPAVGGVVLSELTALAASTDGRKVYAVWAEKSGRDFEFARAGFIEHLRGRRVLLVEDLLTTGGSLARVHERAIEHGADVVGASVICNRGGVTARSLGLARLTSLAEVKFAAFDPQECPLCQEGVPIVENVGHGADYRRQHPEYVGGYQVIRD